MAKEKMMNELISRSAAIDALNEVDDGASISTAITVIEGMPSAQPERKNGKWERVDMHYEDAEQNFDYHEYFCSECGVKRKIGWSSVNFCPNCGADMREQP